MTAMTRRVLLIVALAGLVIRLAMFVVDVGQTSLQMDLSSFYAYIVALTLCLAGLIALARRAIVNGHRDLE